MYICQYRESVVFAADWPQKKKQPVPFNDQSPLVLSNCGTNPFCMYYTAPILKWRLVDFGAVYIQIGGLKRE